MVHVHDQWGSVQEKGILSEVLRVRASDIRARVCVGVTVRMLHQIACACGCTCMYMYNHII